MPAPKVDLKKFAAHIARNKKPKKMTSTQKSLSDISKRANENYSKEYARHVQAGGRFQDGAEGLLLHCRISGSCSMPSGARGQFRFLPL